MPEEPFFERFRRVLQEHGLRPEQAATIMETSVDVVRRLCDGRTKQAKFDEALRLCERLRIDPWYLAFGRDRTTVSALQLRGQGDEDVSLREEVMKLRERLDNLAGLPRLVADLSKSVEAIGHTQQLQGTQTERGSRSK